MPDVKILADWNHDGEVEELPAPLQSPEHFVIALPLAGVPAAAPSEDTAWSQPGQIHPAEIGKVVVQVNGPLPAGAALMLRVDQAAVGRVSLFQKRDGQWSLLGAEGTWKVDLEPAGRPHAELGVVAHSLAHAGWSGDFDLTVSFVSGDGLESGTWQVSFRVAPFLLASALDPAEEVLVVENPRTAGFARTLERTLQEMRVPMRRIRVPGDEAEEYDRWPQDALEIGRICAPSGRDVLQVVAVLTGLRAKHETMNCEPLDRRARKVFKDRAAILADVGVPRAGTRWIDWYGNLEVSPPVRSRDGREFPLGRILIGRQLELDMHPDVLAFLEAQRAQTPPLVVDTSWLGIGHVDEVVSFVPAPGRPGFRVLFPGISLARAILEAAIAQGHARQAAFAGHKEEMTAEALLEEIALSEENRQIEAVLDETKHLLCEGLGIEEGDFVELPVLFKAGMAVIPNSINSLIINGHAVVPDPLGPQVDGEDAFARAIRTALSKCGIQVHFVDVWDTFHWLGGEIHCGTNAVRRISNPLWWKAAPAASA
jgi:protein-arginine deiminase